MESDANSVYLVSELNPTVGPPVGVRASRCQKEKPNDIPCQKSARLERKAFSIVLCVTRSFVSGVLA